jgi:hypothetical protein
MTTTTARTDIVYRLSVQSRITLPKTYRPEEGPKRVREHLINDEDVAGEEVEDTALWRGFKVGQRGAHQSQEGFVMKLLATAECAVQPENKGRHNGEDGGR